MKISATKTHPATAFFTMAAPPKLISRPKREPRPTIEMVET
jgi:hypothetical protein